MKKFCHKIIWLSVNIIDKVIKACLILTYHINIVYTKVIGVDCHKRVDGRSD